MPPRKRQKTDRVNWDDSDSESSSSSEEESSLEYDQEELDHKKEDDQERSTSKKEENPYLVTKGEGRFREDRTVFIGQLPKEATAPQIRALFSRSGTISRIVVMKFKDTGRPMGSAFIEFDQVEGANNAISRNGESYKGKTLRINMSSQKPSKSSSANLSRDKDAKLVYVGNLNFKSDRAELIQFFKNCGKIVNIDFPRWKDSNKKRGFAMVEFLDSKSIKQAVKLNGKELDGREVIVELRSDNRGTKKNSGNIVGQKRKRQSSKK